MVPLAVHLRGVPRSTKPLLASSGSRLAVMWRSTRITLASSALVELGLSIKNIRTLLVCWALIPTLTIRAAKALVWGSDRLNSLVMLKRNFIARPPVFALVVRGGGWLWFVAPTLFDFKL